FALARVQKPEVRSQKSESECPTSDFRPLSSPSIAVLGAILIALIAVILIWAWRFPFPTDNVRATMLNGLTRAGFLLAGVGLLFAMARGTRTRWLRLAPVALLLVAWLDV